MAARFPIQAKPGRAALPALLLLSFLLALGAMRSDLFPDSAAGVLPPMEREALPFALLACASTLFAIARKAKWPRGLQLRPTIAVSLGLFVLPAVLVYASANWASAYTRVALFSLTPVFAVVFEPHIEDDAPSQQRGGLLASLAALVGAFCIFPVDLPLSLQSGLAFVAVIAASACAAAANCHAVCLAAKSPRGSFAPMAAIASASAAIGFAAAGAITQGLTFPWTAIHSELLWSALVALPGLFLLFWLMPRMTATRMTTRFLLAPLIAILISIALDRPKLELHVSLGILLITAGAAWLLFAPDREPGADNSLLSL
jgi:drug/metabolite transporter (DMT)-like permease